MDDASPPKWHLAHITWFFETFILKEYVQDYEPFDVRFEYLFNSYYNGVGKPYPRSRRGHLSRPTVQEVLNYRSYVDEAMRNLLDGENSDELRFRVELGLNHEQQHQELMLTDLKYNFGNNPLFPAYSMPTQPAVGEVTDLSWVEFEGGLVEIGAQGSGFVFDNETPRHTVYLRPFRLASRAVTNGEFINFIEDGGYERHDLWLSDGWGHLNGLPDRWSGPLYWSKDGNDYVNYTFTGLKEVDPGEPVCHVSAYEADAYARWAGARLPLEPEWESASAGVPLEGNFVESSRFHPAHQQGEGLPGLFGDVWEWTSTSYGPYPGFKPFAGALGEYNGKFMANQLVLRGGSCATPASHIRASYRNFFYPPDRWQYTGIRLAQDI